MKKLSVIAAALLASAASVSADAATITISGNFGGVFAGQNFDPQAATFTLLTDEGTNVLLGASYEATSLTAGSTLNGQPFNFVFQGSGYYFGQLLSGLDNTVGQGNEILFNYGLRGFRGSSTDFQTNAGTVRITSGTDIVTTITPGAATAAVPEPATWSLMLLGVGMVGAGLRSRRRNTSVTFA